jgi:hypothetical protein
VHVCRIRRLRVLDLVESQRSIAASLRGDAWQATCRCGWEGSIVRRRLDAQLEARSHEAERRAVEPSLFRWPRRDG